MATVRHLGFLKFDILKPVHTSNNVEATLSNATKSNVASTLLPFLATLLPFSATMLKQRSTLLLFLATMSNEFCVEISSFRQCRMLLRHCCWCGRGLTGLLWRISVRYCIKFRADRSIRCGDNGRFSIFKVAAVRNLGFVMFGLDHPRRVFGCLCDCAKFGFWLTTP